ncbi:hypothetical protein Tco_0251856 [Tanacetum coccineum]
MDGRGASSCIMLGSSSSGLSFSTSPSVRLSDVGRGGAGKGGSWVLTPDLVVMAKVGASGSGVSLFLIVERIWENYSCNSLRCWSSISPNPFAWDFFSSIKLASSSSNLLLTVHSGPSSPFSLHLLFPHGGYRCFDKTSEGKDHRICIPRTSILARPGWFACIHQPRGILRSSRRLGRVFQPNLSGMCFKIILVLDIIFNLIPPLIFGERAEAELSELIEFPTVVPGYVIVKDLYQKPFMYPMMGDLFD